MSGDGARGDGARTGIFGVLVRIEALKTVKRLGFWVTTGIFFVFNVAFAIGNIRSDIARPGYTYALPGSWPEILQVFANVGPFFLGVTMILLLAPEFSWRTARQNVIDGLSKERFYAGKLILLLALLVLFAAIPVAVGGTAALLGPSESSSPLVGPADFNYMIAYALNLLVWASGAVMLATLLRASGAAMGIMFVYLLVEQIVAALLGRSSDMVASLLEFLPAALHGTLADPLMHYPQMLAERNAARAEQGIPPLEYPDFGLTIAVALAYSALFLATAFLTLRRKDL